MCIKLLIQVQRINTYYYFTHQLNTYQCVLATDGDRSYALFLYEDIQWTTSSDSGGVGGLGGNPAIVGFNAGDGVRSVEIPDSNTNEIVNIETTSNIGVPGLWVFRVDEQEIVPIRDCTINISLSASGALSMVTINIITHSACIMQYLALYRYRKPPNTTQLW